jgi:hypothetical protein
MVMQDPAAMRLLFNDWKIRYKKTYKTPQLVSLACQGIRTAAIHTRTLVSHLQDKQAFAKFTANVKAIAKANLKNPNYFQVFLQR